MNTDSFIERIGKEVIGVIPAGGLATRITPIPCSKEIYPIGFLNENSGGDSGVKVVSQYLLERMKLAGIRNVFFILRPSKWDIPDYYGDGSIAQINIGYLMLGVPYGTPFTLNQAYPFVSDKIVALGFPDILFNPPDAYLVILDRLYSGDADIVLGLFKTDQPHKMDMVNIDSQGKFKEILIKPKNTTLEYTWTVAVWKPSFSKFMNDYVKNILNRKDSNTDFMKIQGGRELYVGDVLIAAHKGGLRIESVHFPHGFTMDVGTPDDLRRAIIISDRYNFSDLKRV